MKEALIRFGATVAIIFGTFSLGLGITEGSAQAQMPVTTTVPVIYTCPGGTPPCGTQTCPPQYTKCNVDPAKSTACICQ